MSFPARPPSREMPRPDRARAVGGDRHVGRAVGARRAAAPARRRRSARTACCGRTRSSRRAGRSRGTAPKRAKSMGGHCRCVSEEVMTMRGTRRAPSAAADPSPGRRGRTPSESRRFTRRKLPRKFTWKSSARPSRVSRFPSGATPALLTRRSSRTPSRERPSQSAVTLARSERSSVRWETSAPPVSRRIASASPSCPGRHGEHDARAAARQLRRDGAPQPRARAGDEAGPAVEPVGLGERGKRGALAVVVDDRLQSREDRVNPSWTSHPGESGPSRATSWNFR